MYNGTVVSIALRLYNNKNELNLKICQIMKILNIARSTLYNWIHLYNNNSSFTNNKIKLNEYRKFCKKNVNNKITPHIIDFIVSYVKEKKIFSIKKLRQLIFDKFIVTISKSHLYYILKRNNLTYKQMQKFKADIDSEKFKEDKIILQQQITNARRNIISIDETSIELGLRPNKGWSIKNTRCPFKVTNKRQRFSLVMAVNKSKIIAVNIVRGSYNGESFQSFIEKNVIPKSKKASLLMDNARIHHYKKFKQFMADNNKNIIYNVPYCPSYNPIEYVFNLLKMEIRKQFIDTLKQLETFISSFIKKINNNGLHNFFNKSFNNLFGK